MRVINLASTLSNISEHWSPKIAGELNGQHVRLAKLKGEFVWHHHGNEDELFLVLRGTLRLKTREEGRETEYRVAPGEFIIVPRGVEHCPIADDEVHVLLFEPASTLNTGNIENERTVRELGSV